MNWIESVSIKPLRTNPNEAAPKTKAPYLEVFAGNTFESTGRRVMLVVDILISVILLSLAFRCLTLPGRPELAHLFQGRPSTLGFSDPYYFLSSAFLWLQGLFFIRLLGAASHVEHFSLSTWIRPIFGFYAVTLVLFFLFQFFTHIPEPLGKNAFYFPLEDISSFGSIVVAVFVFLAASWQRTSWRNLLFNVICLNALALATVASWSRATWLAGALFLVAIAMIRLPRKWTITLVAAVAVVLAVLNLNAKRESWARDPYLARLISLARWENPGNKSPERVNLYYKAFSMIREHPLTGHGIGSFYLSSVNYARRDDPAAKVPDFAHNVFLQFAAELGVPITSLFVALVGWALTRGWLVWRSAKEKSDGEREISFPTTARPVGITDARQHRMQAILSSKPKIAETDEFAILGVTLALAAYSLTQMTANSLNVYITNQFFFWFLIWALLYSTRSKGINNKAIGALAIRP